VIRPVPAPYAGAERLGADGNACLSLARAKWHTLKRVQQTALIMSTRIPGGRRLGEVGQTTSTSMRDQGLVASCDRCATLTGFGEMVREAGQHARAEALEARDEQ
jgi:hypothetical protein